MEKPRTNSWVPIAALAAVGLVLFVATLASMETAQEAASLANLPRATVASPVSRRAVYRGKLYGPPARVTPLKAKAAAFWWSVTTGTSKSRKVTCRGFESLELELRDGDATLPIVAFGGKASVLSDKRDNDWTERWVIDVGSLLPLQPSKPPVPCQGTSPNYVEHSIPQGTEVEIAACYRNNALSGCDVGLAAVISVPKLLVHRERRAERAFIPFLVGAISCTSIVTALLVLSIVAARRTLRPLRPGKSS